MIRARTHPAKRGEVWEFEVDAPFEMLQVYLYDDLQIASVTRDANAWLRRVLDGSEAPSEHTGNAWAVMPGATTTRVENMYTDAAIDVPTADLVALLEHWLAHVIERCGDA